MVIGVDGVIGVHAVHHVVTARNTDQECVTIPPQLMVALLARDRLQKLLVVNYKIVLSVSELKFLEMSKREESLKRKSIIDFKMESS